MKCTVSIPMAAGRFRQYELSEESSALVETLKGAVQRPVTQLSSDEVTRIVVAFAEIGKKDGILALEILFPYIRDGFLKEALQLLMDGTEPELLRDILEKRIGPIEDIGYRKVIEGIVAIQQGATSHMVQQRVQA